MKYKLAKQSNLIVQRSILILICQRWRWAKKIMLFVLANVLMKRHKFMMMNLLQKAVHVDLVTN